MVDVRSVDMEHMRVRREDPVASDACQVETDPQSWREGPPGAGREQVWHLEQGAEPERFQDAEENTHQVIVRIPEENTETQEEVVGRGISSERQNGSGAVAETPQGRSGTMRTADPHRASNTELVPTTSCGTLPVSDNLPNFLSFRNESSADDFHILVIQDPDGLVSNIVWKGQGERVATTEGDTQHREQVSTTQEETQHHEHPVEIVRQPWTHESTIHDLHDPHALLIFKILCALLALDVLYTLAIFIYTMIGTDPVDDSLKFDPAVPFLLPILSGRGLAFLLLGGTIIVCIAAYLGGKQVRTSLLVFSFLACIALVIVSAVDAFSLETIVKAAILIMCLYLRRVLLSRAELNGINLAQIIRIPRRSTRPPLTPFVTVVLPERHLDAQVSKEP